MASILSEVKGVTKRNRSGDLGCSLSYTKFAVGTNYESSMACPVILYSNEANMNYKMNQDYEQLYYICGKKYKTQNSLTVHKTRFQLILPVQSQNPQNFKVVIEW